RQGRARSAATRTRPRPPPAARGSHSRPSGAYGGARASASEGLSDADVELGPGITRSADRWCCYIQANGPKARVIATADPRPKQHLLLELRQGGRIVAAGIEKRHDADAVGDLDPRFEAQFESGFAADRLVVGIEITRHLIAVGADRTAAAGIDALVRR